MSTTSNAPNLFVHADYTKVRGLQVESQSEGRHYAVRVAAAGVEVTDNIIKGANMASMKNWNFGILLSEDSDANVANNIIYHFKSAGKKGRGIVGGKNSDACVYNNTIYGCDVGLDRGLGGGTWITQNNISYRNKNNFHGEFEATSRNNLSGPVEGGAPGLKAVNKTFVDFLDEDGLDFHLNALDAHARNGGANLITDELFAFAQDIDGDPRAKPWDIGADESGASAVITHSIGASARDFATLQAWEDAREGDLTKRHVFRTVRQSNAFTDGETVTNTSGASGTYVKERDIPSAGEKVMTLDGVTGMFSTGDKLTGGASGATATLEMALAASGVIERGEAHMDAVFTEGVVIDGSTTDAGHYMVLTAAPRSRHIGRAGTGAIIDMQGKKADAITVDDDYARVEGLEVSNWGGAHAAVKVESGADGIVVRHMIIHDNDAASAGSNDIPVAINLTNDTGLMRAANNIIYNIANKNAKKGVGIMLLTSTATRIESNVIYNAAGAGLDTNQSRAVIVENNIAAGNGEDFTGKYAAASDYNISSDGSAPGANALNDRAVADIAFISTDAGAEDLGTMIGSAAREITAALSLDSSDDAVARAARYSAAWHAGDDAWFPSFAAGYHNAGIFVSRVHDTKQRPFYMTLSWNANIPIGASLVIRVRTGDHPELAGATEWKECPILVTNENVDIARLISVSDGARYVQYRAELISDDGTATPVLEDVTVTYKGYPLDAKELVSSAFDTGIKGNVITRLSWEETIHKGIDGVNIQLRSAPDENGAPGLWSDWLGPKGAEDYYADMTKSVVINPAHQDGIDDQWVQYKARLFTIGLATPVLSGINIVFGGDLTGLEIPSETQPEPTAAEPEPEPVDPQTVTGLTSEEQAALEAAVDKFVEASPDDGTRLYDVVVKLGDNYNSDPGEDARASYKEGDVVVIRPSGHLWSVIERNGFLIIRAYLTEDESRQLTLPQEIVTGEKDEDGRSVKEMVKRRANRIDLTKLGLSKRSDTGKRALKLRALRGTLKAKALKRGLIEEK
ncbi:MAG: right-handed parallel beta-helix repeat-containing protein [Candidatus Omnitrophica bacterium]|nr:right-handed parallel beta-helix repeat-containing protein [Candidatus Omnitrophota bacterium]